MTMPVDHEALLAKYMAVVAEQEGTAFVECCYAPRFTPEELAALNVADERCVDLMWPDRGDNT